MNPEENPYLQQEDYWAGYRENIEKLKQRPEAIELDKLCWEVFEENAQGKMLLKLIEERFLLPALARPGAPDYQIACVYYEGFKEAFRMIKGSVLHHRQRIEMESKQQ